MEKGFNGLELIRDGLEINGMRYFSSMNLTLMLTLAADEPECERFLAENLIEHDHYGRGHDMGLNKSQSKDRHYDCCRKPNT